MKLLSLSLSAQVDLRHRLVSKTVEEVQKIIKDLTAEVSIKDARFLSIANSGVHNNDNMKVSAPITRHHFLLMMHLGSKLAFLVMVY